MTRRSGVALRPGVARRLGVALRPGVARRRESPPWEWCILAVETVVSFELAVDIGRESTICLGVVFSNSAPRGMPELEGLGVRPASSGVRTHDVGRLGSWPLRVAVQHSRDAVLSNT